MLNTSPPAASFASPGETDAVIQRGSAIIRIYLIFGSTLMDVAVSVFAVVVALGCFIAIFLASRKDSKKESGEE